MSNYVPINSGADAPKSLIAGVSLDDVTSEPKLATQEPVVEAAPEVSEPDVTVNLKTGKVNEVKEAVDEVVVAETAVDEPAAVVAPKVEAKKPSRAQKRIKQLHTQNVEKDTLLSTKEQEIASLKKQLLEGTKETKTSMQTTLTNSVTTLNDSLRDAVESGESDKVVSIQNQLMDAKMQLAGLTSEIQKIEATPEPTVQQAAPATQDVPEKAMEWIDAHPSFQSDKMFYMNAMAINSQLVEEGFDHESTDFYSELDSRMSNLFPQEFGVGTQNSVQYTEASNEADDEKQEASTKSDSTNPKVEQTVSGASRSPSVKGKKTSSKDNVVLSQQSVKQAERWGLPLEKVARRVAHLKNNDDGSGYSSIIINNKK